LGDFLRAPFEPKKIHRLTKVGVDPDHIIGGKTVLVGKSEKGRLIANSEYKKFILWEVR
jgi:hypothetical protein